MLTTNVEKKYKEKAYTSGSAYGEQLKNIIQHKHFPIDYSFLTSLK